MIFVKNILHNDIILCHEYVNKKRNHERLYPPLLHIHKDPIEHFQVVYSHITMFIYISFSDILVKVSVVSY